MQQLLDFEDPLGCMACWDIFTNLMAEALHNKDDERLAVISAWLLPRIRPIVQSIPTMDASLKSGLVLIAASVVGLSMTPSAEIQSLAHYSEGWV